MLKSYKSATNEELKKAIEVCESILSTDTFNDEIKKSFQKCSSKFQEEIEIRKRAWDIVQSEIEVLLNEERIS